METQVFTNCRIDKSIVACSCDGILCSSEKEKTTTATATTTIGTVTVTATTTTNNNMGDSHQYNDKQKKVICKRMHDYIYIKFKNQVKINMVLEVRIWLFLGRKVMTGNGQE